MARKSTKAEAKARMQAVSEDAQIALLKRMSWSRMGYLLPEKNAWTLDGATVNTDTVSALVMSGRIEAIGTFRTYSMTNKGRREAGLR